MTDRRVALVAPTLAQGGAEKQLALIAGALHRRGVDVRVFAFAEGEHHEASLRAQGVPVATTTAGRGGRLLWLWRELRAFGPHVIASSHFYGNAYAGLVGRALRIPSFGAIRGEVAFEMASTGRLGGLSLRLPRFLIANSEAAREVAAGAGRRVFVLGNAIDIEAFDAVTEPVDLGPHPVVVSVANHRPEKRLDVFLETIAALRRRDVAVTGALVGDGPERAALEKLAASLEIMDDVRFLGRRDDVPAVLAASSVLLLTSDNEAFPNVVMEAMAARLPAVVTDVGDSARIVEDGVTGCVVPRRDAAAAAAAVERVLRDPARAEAMGAAGRARVEARYGVAALADRVLAVFDAATTSHG